MKFILSIILLFLILNPESLHAQQSIVCNSKGYTILTINGINTSKQQAESNLTALTDKIHSHSYNNQPIDYKYIHNQSHIAGLGDLTDAITQKLHEYDPSAPDYDLVEMWRSASEKVKTQKVLIVAHSQGNFYANAFYNIITTNLGVPSNSLGVYGVASPTSYVAGDGLYTTADTDQVINGLRGDYLTVLPANINIKLQGTDIANGHSFSDIYLKYGSEKIISDIKFSLNKLKENNTRLSPCIPAPEIDFTHKVTKAIFIVADPTALAVKNTAAASYNLASNFGNSILAGIGSLFGKKNNGLTANVVDSQITQAQNDTQPIAPQVENKKEVVPKDNSKNTESINPPKPPVSEQDVTINNIIEDIQEIIEEIPVQDGNKNKDVATVPQLPVYSPAYVEPVRRDGSNPVPDTTPPVITIAGDNPMVITENSLFNDPGSSALDEKDGTVSVSVVGIVTSAQVGTYTLTYSATDAAGNIATASRTVTVVYDTQNFSSSDLNENNIPDVEESQVVVNTNQTLVAGEYAFNDLIVSDNAVLTLQGDPDSLNTFKGVKIRAVNITVDPGSIISADQKGYSVGNGPGVSVSTSIGASYGGTSYGGVESAIYGSATAPVDLGSAGAQPYKGGGAIRIIVSDTLNNKGTITADGGLSSSGGSIYLHANNLEGDGTFHANGGGLFSNGYFKSPGGGGRVAVYYKSSSFSGVIEAKGGCGNYNPGVPDCGTSGSVGVFDQTNNNAYLAGGWKFMQSDGPFNYADLIISNNAHVSSESNVAISSNNLILKDTSQFLVGENQILTISTVTLKNSAILTLAGSETINTNKLNIEDDSEVTVLSLKSLYLSIPEINISSGSSISANSKGYGFAVGSLGPGGATETYDADNPGPYYSGGSYGGAGHGADPSRIYGSKTEPIDFGSTGNLTGTPQRGGGAIRIIATNLVNDGSITANGGPTGSGGSVYITTQNLSGNGIVHAKGGESDCNSVCRGAGGGGRIAIHYFENLFLGNISASGWNGSVGGPSEDGTIEFILLVR